jgi:hypothetical protein
LLKLFVENQEDLKDVTVISCAEHLRDLQGECFNMAPFSSSLSSVSTQHFIHFLLSFSSNNDPYHEDVWGSGGIATPLLTLALNRGENGQLHAPASLLAGKERPVPIQ